MAAALERKKTQNLKGLENASSSSSDSSSYSGSSSEESKHSKVVDGLKRQTNKKISSNLQKELNGPDLLRKQLYRMQSMGVESEEDDKTKKNVWKKVRDKRNKSILQT